MTLKSFFDPLRARTAPSHPVSESPRPDVRFMPDGRAIRVSAFDQAFAGDWAQVSEEGDIEAWSKCLP